MKYKIAVFADIYDSYEPERRFINFVELECEPIQKKEKIEQALAGYMECRCDHDECQGCSTWYQEISFDIVGYDADKNKFYTKEGLNKEILSLFQEMNRNMERVIEMLGQDLETKRGDWEE